MRADVYEQLRELVMTGQVMPGEQISLRNAAAALGVSVMPVREAMQRLVAENALEVAPNRAVRVPRMTVSQFREITTIRINLEGLATKLAALALSNAQLDEIQRLSDCFATEMAAASPNGSRLIAFNKDLHFAVYRGANMPMLLHMIETLWLRIGPILNYDLRAGSRRVDERVAVRHHSAWLGALRKRDATAAHKALKGDIESAAEFIVSAGMLVSADS
ncbi:MAG: GntR family transcriptional regulator [Rhodoferax sp.]|nr:GntR family transcriptional regulator [Rhodoferax sp.]